MTKRIKVLCNPAETPVKFPSDVKYFYASESAKVGEKTAERIIKNWAGKNN